MRVGDLVKHRDYPWCFGIVLSYDEFGTNTIRWLTTHTPTRKGAISKHNYRILKLLSEA
jgi:hypothetical protein